MKQLSTLLVAGVLLSGAHAAFAGDEDPPPTFEDHPGICMVHPLAAPQLSPGDADTWLFRTRIREGTDGVCANFDGAFTVVTWGCGSPCQQGVMVDRTDGKIYWLPDTASYGYEYHAESSLLIMNSFTKADFPDGNIPDWLEREFYLFSHGKWTLIYSDKGATSLE